MQPETIRSQGYAMPFTSPAYPRGPYRYVGRETFTIAYRSDAAAVAPMHSLGGQVAIVTGATAIVRFVLFRDRTHR